jgi:hypothetical protein
LKVNLKQAKIVTFIVGSQKWQALGAADSEKMAKKCGKSIQMGSSFKVRPVVEGGRIS